MMGFSAGGHLALATATRFEKRTYEPVDETDKLSCRPDFAVPVYSGYLKEKEKRSTAGHSEHPANNATDFSGARRGGYRQSAGRNSVIMYLALKRAGVSAELHIYADTLTISGCGPMRGLTGNGRDVCGLDAGRRDFSSEWFWM